MNIVGKQNECKSPNLQELQITSLQIYPKVYSRAIMCMNYMTKGFFLFVLQVKMYSAPIGYHDLKGSCLQHLQKKLFVTGSNISLRVIFHSILDLKEQFLFSIKICGIFLHTIIIKFKRLIRSISQTSQGRITHIRNMSQQVLFWKTNIL